MIPDIRSLEILKEMKEKLREITFYDLDINKVWLSHVFQIEGELQTTIDILEEDIKTGKYLQKSDMWGYKR